MSQEKEFDEKKARDRILEKERELWTWGRTLWRAKPRVQESRSRWVTPCFCNRQNRDNRDRAKREHKIRDRQRDGYVKRPLTYKKKGQN